MRTKFFRRSFWVEDTPSGGIRYRTGSKVMFTLLPIALAALFYKLLVVVGNLEHGPRIIVVLAYAVIILMVALILLMIIISLIEYLRKFE